MSGKVGHISVDQSTFPIRFATLTHIPPTIQQQFFNIPVYIAKTFEPACVNKL